MDTMPERYETTQTTTTNVEHTQQTAVQIGLNLPYLRSLPGMLKIAEAVLGLIVIICVAAQQYWSSHSSGGFIVFVAIFSLVTTLILFFFHFTNVIYKLPGPWVLIEFCYLIITILLYLISGIIAAAYSYLGGGAIAAAIFCFVVLVVYAVEGVLCFRVWRGGSGFFVASRTDGPAASGAATTTTTTTVRQENYVS